MRKSTTGLTPGWGEPCSPGQAEACPTTRTFLSPARASRSAVPVRPYRPARTSPAAAGSLLEGLTLKPSAKAYQVFYNEAVQSHWRETTVGEHGELVMEGLPLEPASQLKCWWSRKPHERPRRGTEACEIRFLSSKIRSSLLPARTGTLPGVSAGRMSASMACEGAAQVIEAWN
jgi:hypothetical protein